MPLIVLILEKLYINNRGYRGRNAFSPDTLAKVAND